MMAMPASADPTPVDITVTSEAYAPDGAGHVTPSGGFLYDPSRGDTAADAYPIAYRGILDMTQVWSDYQTFRTLWLFANGFDVDRYQNTKTFSGEFVISFTVDTSVVEADTSFVSCSFVQSAMATQNPGTQFGDIMRCQTATFDPVTGVFTATFKLGFADGSPVYGRDLDNPDYRPDTLTLTTPPQALYVPQSNFEPGRTFVMTNPTVTGWMQMDAFYVGMPLTFDDIGADVPLTMYPTYSASYSFVACEAGETLPSAVTDLTPATEYMYVDGTVVTGPTPTSTSVPGDRGVWTFQGWDSTPTINGEDVTITGCWQWEPDPNALWNVSFTFEAEDGSTLPADVLSAVPSAVSGVTGTVVNAPAPTLSTYTETTTSGVETVETVWSFTGWDRPNLTIGTRDEVVTGTWAVAQTISLPAAEPQFIEASQCGVRSTVVIPTSTRLIYSSTEQGDIVTVTVEPRDGVVITSDQTTWEYNIAARSCGTGLPVTGADVPFSVLWSGLAFVLLGTGAVIAGTKRRTAA